jgi:hypothetical protein
MLSSSFELNVALGSFPVLPRPFEQSRFLSHPCSFGKNLRIWNPPVSLSCALRNLIFLSFLIVTTIRIVGGRVDNKDRPR